MGREMLCESRFGFRFDESASPGRARDTMSACEEFETYTCCEKHHTDYIKRKNIEVAAAQFRGSCQDVSRVVHCMPCQGFVGAGEIRTICPDVCDRWFRACREEFYTLSSLGGDIQPCFGDPLMCSRLDTIVSSGEELCERSGLNVGVASGGGETARCYDGSMDREVVSERLKNARAGKRGSSKKEDVEKRRSKRKRRKKRSGRETWRDVFGSEASAMYTAALLVAAMIPIVVFMARRGVVSIPGLTPKRRSRAQRKPRDLWDD